MHVVRLLSFDEQQLVGLEVDSVHDGKEGGVREYPSEHGFAALDCAVKVGAPRPHLVEVVAIAAKLRELAVPVVANPAAQLAQHVHPLGIEHAAALGATNLCLIVRDDGATGPVTVSQLHHARRGERTRLFQEHFVRQHVYRRQTQAQRNNCNQRTKHHPF